MSDSIDTIESDLREAQERIRSGEIVVELDTNLIEPSFISDRIDQDAGVDEIVSSIREHGQRTPILVRPHPEKPERYQIAFGHRRYRALQILGRPVKALVKSLSDAQLVVAQGQENQSRLDLSYIDRAMFAARLEAGHFPRDVICSALNIDKTEASRMISVATSLPNALVDAIGSAHNTGRRKWMELAKILRTTNWTALQDKLLAASREAGPESDEKFDAVLHAANEQRGSARTPKGMPRFKIERKEGLIRISFDETRFPEEVIADCVTQIHAICTRLGAKQ